MYYLQKSKISQIINKMTANKSIWLLAISLVVIVFVSGCISQENIKTSLLGPKIDSTWVHNFISIVNQDRSKEGLYLLRETSALDRFACTRFNKMLENPNISHYGAGGGYTGGEVVFYPEGSTEQEYVDDLKQSAPLHWDLLVNPGFATYGYCIGEGPTTEIIGSCSTTEIPGPNINVEDFFRQKGCTTETVNSTWLVIEL